MPLGVNTGITVCRAIFPLFTFICFSVVFFERVLFCYALIFLKNCGTKQRTVLSFFFFSPHARVLDETLQPRAHWGRMCSLAQQALHWAASPQFNSEKQTHICLEAEVDAAKGGEIKGCMVQCPNKGSGGYESPFKEACSHAEEALQGFSIIPRYLDTRLKSGGFYLDRDGWLDWRVHRRRMRTSCPPPRRGEGKQCSTRLHIHYSKINLH